MGCANIAQRSVIPALLGSGVFDLVAIASRELSKAESFTGKFGGKPIEGYDKLLELEDIEAVYMPLPTGLHEKWITRALEKGKHVLAEKSLAKNHGSAIGMLDLAKRRNLVLMENFMYRHHSQHQFAFELLRSGKLGSIRLFTARFGFPPLAVGNFRYDVDLGGGALLDAAAYTVNASRWFLGDDLEVLDAVLYRDPASGVILYGNASLFSSSMRMTSNIAFGFDNLYQCYYEIWGSKGLLRMERAFTAPPGHQPKAMLSQQGFQEERLLESDDHFVNILKKFRQCIQNGEVSEQYNDLFHQSRILSEIECNAKIIEI